MMLIKLNDRGIRVYMATAKYRARLDWKSRTGRITKYSRDRSVVDVIWNGTHSFDRVSIDLIEPATSKEIRQLAA
jgi:hypothetical protein